VVVLVVVAIDVALPQRSGPIDGLAVWEQLVFLTALIAIPFALLGRERGGYVVVALLVATALLRYGPQWLSFPASGEPALSVTTWNVELGTDAGNRVTAGLANVSSDLVALQEFQPAMQKAITSDAALSGRYPYPIFEPHNETLGAALLSRYPIMEQQSSLYPTYIRAVVQPPTLDRPLVVYVVHPQPPAVTTGPGLPMLDTQQRSADQATIRALIDADLAAGQSVLVLGDLNTTEREQAYADFTRGLHDAHLDAGTGPGLTWRPEELKAVPFGLIRIDYVLTTPDLAALSSSVNCTNLSDHCQVSATLR
jgi:vancomycin resistance protein VanJ